MTDIVPGQEEWSILNLPEILYTFRSPQKRRRKYPPVPRKPNPRPGGRPLKVLECLPDRISNNVEEFKVEAWMRQDPRIQLSDIIDRMPVGNELNNNALQQRGVRFRRAFNIVAWGTCNIKTKAIEARTERMLRRRGLNPKANSTRGLTPGLINPALGEAGGRIPLPHSFAKRYGFISDDEEPPRKKSSRAKKSKKSKKQVTGDEDLDEDLDELNDDEGVNNDNPRDEDYRGEEEKQQGEDTGESNGHGESGADEDEDEVEIKIEEDEEEGLEHIKQYESDDNADCNHHALAADAALQHGSSLNVLEEVTSAEAEEFDNMMGGWLIESEHAGWNQNPVFGTTLANGTINPNVFANVNANVNPNAVFNDGFNSNFHAYPNTIVNPDFNPNFHAVSFDTSLDHSYDPSLDPRFNPILDVNFDSDLFTGFDLNPSTNFDVNAAVNAHINADSNFAVANSNDTGIASTQVYTHIGEETSPGPEAHESGHQTPEASVGTPSSADYTPSPQEEPVGGSYSRGIKRRRDEDEESEYQDEGSDPSSDDSDYDNDDNDDGRSSYRSPSRASKRPALMMPEAPENPRPVLSSPVENVQNTGEALGYQQPTVEDEHEPEDPAFRNLIDMFGGDYVDDNTNSLPQPPLVRDMPPPPTQYVDVKVQQAAAFERIAGTIKMLFGETMASNWEKWALDGL